MLLGLLVALLLSLPFLPGVYRRLVKRERNRGGNGAETPAHGTHGAGGHSTKWYQHLAHNTNLIWRWISLCGIIAMGYLVANKSGLATRPEGKWLTDSWQDHPAELVIAGILILGWLIIWSLRKKEHSGGSGSHSHEHRDLWDRIGLSPRFAAYTAIFVVLIAGIGLNAKWKADPQSSPFAGWQMDARTRRAQDIAAFTNAIAGLIKPVEKVVLRDKFGMKEIRVFQTNIVLVSDATFGDQMFIPKDDESIDWGPPELNSLIRFFRNGVEGTPHSGPMQRPQGEIRYTFSTKTNILRGVYVVIGK